MPAHTKKKKKLNQRCDGPRTEQSTRKNQNSLLTALSNSSMKHFLTASLVGLQPHRSRLEVRSENFE